MASWFSANCSWTSAPDVASELDLAFGEGPRRPEVPDLRGDDGADTVASKPELMSRLVRTDLDILNGGQRPAQRRTRGDVALGQPDRQCVEDDIECPFRLLRRWGSACRGRCQEDDIGRVRATCPDGRRQRIEVRLARDVAIDRFELPRGIEQAVAPSPCAVADRRRPGHEGARSRRRAARQAGRPRPARGGRVPRPAGPPRASPTRRRGRAVPDARDRASAWRLVRAAPTRRQSLRAPGPARPTARDRRRPTHPPRASPAPGARHGDPGPFPDRSLPPGLGAPPVARRARRSGTPRHAPWGGGTGPAPGAR